MNPSLQTTSAPHKHPENWGRTIAACQSNYIPWKGYFEMINLADEFIIYDHAQYTRYDWRSRNLIKSPNGLIWLSIPVSKPSGHSRIDEVVISNEHWIQKHFVGISNSYAKAKYFPEFKHWLHHLYVGHREALADSGRDPDLLTNVNEWFMRCICDLVEIDTKITRSTQYIAVDSEEPLSRVDRILLMCKAANADTFLVGPAAKNYFLAEDATRRFSDSGIRLISMDYSRYPEYPQVHPPFEHKVSILDLIFSTGTAAKSNLTQFTM